MKRTGGIAAIGLAMAITAAFLAAPAHSETGVWNQAFERSGPDEACEAPPDETPWQDSFRGQQEWTPSWARWANDGQGGWVCQRTIVWASPTGPQFPAAGCLLVFDNPNEYANFQGGYSLTGLANLYTDSSCTNSGGSMGGPVVYAPPGFDANALCQEAFGLPAKAEFRSSVFACQI